MIAVKERKQTNKHGVRTIAPTAPMGLLWPMVRTQLNRQKLLREKFENYYNNWVDQTWYLSMEDAIVKNENFQAIVNMKEDAVPFILEKLEEEPGFLTVALDLIYNKKVSDNPVTFEEARQLWLEKLKV